MLNNGRLWKFECGEGKDKFIVHWGYKAPFFKPINNKTYYTSLDDLYHRFQRLAHGNGDRTKLWPQVNLSASGEEREYFCGAILYMVLEFGFHPLHPNLYHYDYKVTFLQGSVEGLNLARFTRPDIMFSVFYLARFQSAPTTQKWTALKRILRYVKGTIDTCIRITRNGIYNISDFYNVNNHKHLGVRIQYTNNRLQFDQYELSKNL